MLTPGVAGEELLMNKITEAQQRLLEMFDYEDYRFPPKGKRDVSCYELVQQGLLECELRLASCNYERGTAQLKQAYRRIQPAGKSEPSPTVK